MNILFITSSRIGDAVLSTGLLAHVQRSWPEGRVTVACGPLVTGFFKPAPHVVRVIPLVKKQFSLHWLDLWKVCKAEKWDMIIDLRNSLVSRVLPADKKYIWSRADETLHKVEQLGTVMGLFAPPAPMLWFDAALKSEAVALIPDGGPVLAIAPAANWPGKSWPVSHFIALIERLLAGSMQGYRIAVIAAPGEEVQALPVLHAVPEAQRIDLVGKTSPVLAAACIKRCNAYIGNDSGLTHCAAAAGTPTLALFGPSWPNLYAPWGDHCRYVSTPESYAELTSYAGYHPSKVKDSLMYSLTVDKVYEAASDLVVQV